MSVTVSAFRTVPSDLQRGYYAQVNTVRWAINPGRAAR